MSISNAIPLYLAEAATAELQQLLQPYTERCCVAGSVRRRRDIVGDLELVCIPKIEQVRTSLFPDQINRLEAFCDLVSRGDHHRLYRPKAANGGRAPAWGERWKKLLFKRADGVWLPVDLWITAPERFGAILALRTGDREFSHKLMSTMPAGLRQCNGRLERCVDAAERTTGFAWEPIDTPEEKDFFEALGLPVLDPRQRSEKNLVALLEQRSTRREED